MVDQYTTTYDSTISKAQDEPSGMIYVPVAAQRSEGICIDDEVRVTIRDLDDEFVTEVSFTNPQVAGDYVTVPARLVRRLDLSGGDEVTASFEAVEIEPDDSSSDLGSSQGSVADTDDEPDEAADEPNDLAELFA